MAKHTKVSYSCDVCGVTGDPNPDSNEQEPWPKDWVEMTNRLDSGRSTTNLICTGCITAIARALDPRHAIRLKIDKG